MDGMRACTSTPTSSGKRRSAPRYSCRPETSPASLTSHLTAASRWNRASRGVTQVEMRDSRRLERV